MLEVGCISVSYERITEYYSSYKIPKGIYLKEITSHFGILFPRDIGIVYQVIADPKWRYWQRVYSCHYPQLLPRRGKANLPHYFSPRVSGGSSALRPKHFNDTGLVYMVIADQFTVYRSPFLCSNSLCGLIFWTCIVEVSLFILGSTLLPVGVVYSPFRTPLLIQFSTMWVCDIIKRSRHQCHCSLSSFWTLTCRSRCKRDSHYLFPCL